MTTSIGKYVRIDVSKGRLDAAVLGAEQRNGRLIARATTQENNSNCP